MKPRMLLLAAVCAALLGTAAMATATVKVTGGLVEGTLENGLAVYRRIPFAVPPVGDLRWWAPQPAAKWPGVLRADKFAYIVAKAMDEQQHLLPWKHLNFSYNVHNVWKSYEVPLHPGAERYYKERCYMKQFSGMREVKGNQRSKSQRLPIRRSSDNHAGLNLLDCLRVC